MVPKIFEKLFGISNYYWKGSTRMYEVGDRLYWFDQVSFDPTLDVAPDAPERYATVVEVEENGVVHIEFDDGLVDWLDSKNVQDFLERVTWDDNKRPV
jgi:hypothetical protein